MVALQGVDFGVDWGEMVALLGPSGSGKSTMLAILGGLERPSAGRVLLDGVDVSRLSEAQLTHAAAAPARVRLAGGGPQPAPARLRLGEPRPADGPGRAAGGPAPAPGQGAAGRRRPGRRSASKPIRALSGGEQQRLAVAVALANNPPLLLADEPTSQLDRANVRRVVELLKEARDDLGTTVVVVTHDAEVAAAMDRTVTIRDGRVSAEGRGGAEYAVVGPTGSLHLPAHALDVLPPGARVVVEVEGRPGGAEADRRRVRSHDQPGGRRAGGQARRPQRGRRGVAGGAGRPGGGAGRAVGVGQVDHAAAAGRAGAARRRGRPARRPGPGRPRRVRPPGPAPGPGRARVPGLRPAVAAHGPGERRAAVPGGPARPGDRGRRGRALAGPARPRRPGRPAHRPALGRRAPAGRPGPRPGRRAGRPAGRRAHRRARRGEPRPRRRPPPRRRRPRRRRGRGHPRPRGRRPLRPGRPPGRRPPGRARPRRGR